jgi:hypothetical protein
MFEEPIDMTCGLKKCCLVDIGCNIGKELSILVVGGCCCKWPLDNEPVGVAVCSWEMRANCRLGMPEENLPDIVKAYAGEAILCIDFVV